jgi:AraC family cel operon transcriptional repressor
MLEYKRWRRLVSPGMRHHLAIILFTPGRPARLHTHDFPEVFWLERGEGLHHINGEAKRVSAGDLIFVRPEDRHMLEAVDARGFTLVNLAYDPQIRAGLLRRHPGELVPLLAPASQLPCRALLPKAGIATLRRQLTELSRASTSHVALEYFLLGLHEHIRLAAGADFPPMPEWLRRACEEVQRPEVFALGAPGLTQVAGRSAEHVARTMRTVLGLTPSDYVNRVRMEHAARELRVTARPIAEIALDCGLANLSHFYALFRRAHRLTPRAYRLAHYRTVV